MDNDLTFTEKILLTNMLRQREEYLWRTVTSETRSVTAVELGNIHRIANKLGLDISR